MNDGGYMVFIVEGAKREVTIIKNLKKRYFSNDNVKIITLSSGKNVYMLWKQLKEDDFETDVIEVLREKDEAAKKALEGISRDKISQVYLFFDYDRHQSNLALKDVADPSAVLLEMLQNFDNETDTGKLYISYPSVEALRDYEPDICGRNSSCLCFAKDWGDYKQISAEKSCEKNFGSYTLSVWQDIMNVFVMRISCLFRRDGILSFEEYSNKVTPSAIFEAQKADMEMKRITILSAFPEFLLDYHKENFWNSRINVTEIMNEECTVNRWPRG